MEFMEIIMTWADKAYYVFQLVVYYSATPIVEWTDISNTGIVKLFSKLDLAGWAVYDLLGFPPPWECSLVDLFIGGIFAYMIFVVVKFIADVVF